MEDQLTLPAETASRRVPALVARGVSKTFAGTTVLRSVDLTIAAGEIHAVLGENGSGKSTLIKILSGYHDPDPGAEVSVNGELLAFRSPESSYAHGCRFVHQDLGLVDSASVADNLAFVSGFPCRFGTVRQSELHRTARRDLARVGLDLDPGRLVSTLSPAERTGVAVCRALRDDPTSPVALLVLDEPTATLPETEVHRLLDIVRTVAASGVGILYVTHRLDEVFDIATSITVLRDGARVALLPVTEIDRAGLITLLVGSEFDDVHAEASELPVEGRHPLLQVEDVHTDSLHGVSLDIRPGDVLGIAGITGSGRESLLSVLFGGQPRHAGQIRVHGTPLPPAAPARSMQAGIAYLPADRKTHGAFLDLTTRENVSISDLRPFWGSPVLSRRRERDEVRGWLERLDVRPAGADRMPLATLSGGNQQKVLFAKWLRRAPTVLLLDEPTQGVDVGAKAELHREILRAAREGAGVAVSSSDTDELAALCHRVIVLSEGRVAAHLTGSRVTASEISRACLATTDRTRT
ncbi:MAG: ribose transport system ATP-binding protein [Actinomycetota bacterium]|nr:ribose transport system ATP-binding protein [Actinomycetota bacterium]